MSTLRWFSWVLQVAFPDQITAKAVVHGPVSEKTWYFALTGGVKLTLSNERPGLEAINRLSDLLVTKDQIPSTKIFAVIR